MSPPPPTYSKINPPIVQTFSNGGGGGGGVNHLIPMMNILREMEVGNIDRSLYGTMLSNKL